VKVIEASHVYKVFGRRPSDGVKKLKAGRTRDELRKSGQTAAVIDTSFDVDKGEIFVVMGLSGSGKSTLIRMVNGLLPITAGSMTLYGEDLAHISNDTFPRRYVGAVVSTGYDARVNRSTNHIRLRLGALSYGYIAMRELASFSPLHYDMIIDGVRRRQEAMLVAVSNTGIFGGGMRIAPDADPADGFLDVTVVGPVSRTTLLRLLPSMYSGAFVKHPCVEQFRARSIELAGEGLFVMGDGEELGEVPVRVECVPGVLKVFVA